MNKKITVNTALIKNNQLNLVVNESISGLIPGEHLLVDSEHFSFIYLMENKDDYTYIDIPEPVWPSLKEAMDQQCSAWLAGNDEQLELSRFQEELEYVISNIKGNGNYGMKMVQKVEHLFFKLEV